MAAAFNTEVEVIVSLHAWIVFLHPVFQSIEDELTELIMNGKIQARIDSDKKVSHKLCFADADEYD